MRPSMLTFSLFRHQVERMPILIDSPKKLDHQLSSDPDKTPVSNAANSDSEPEDLNHPGEGVARAVPDGLAPLGA